MDSPGRNLEVHNGEKNANAKSQFPEVSKGYKDSIKTWKGPFMLPSRNYYDFILFVF